MITGSPIKYNDLRKIDKQIARKMVIEFLKENKWNVLKTSKYFRCSTNTVRKCISKFSDNDLSDKSKTPINQPNKTSEELEKLVIDTKLSIRFGARRISKLIYKEKGILIPFSTVRKILHRNKVHCKKHKTYNSIKRDFVDWYKAGVFEIVQIDLKCIKDVKALGQQHCDKIDNLNLYRYQWGALDVKSRFKLISYSREKTWTNGLLWFYYVIAYIRKEGFNSPIVFTVDNGTEFGYSRHKRKLLELNETLKVLNCKIIANHKGSPQENAHLERSHRTDDEEFYIPRLSVIDSNESMYNEAWNYIYYYNNRREHSSLGDITPVDCIRKFKPNLSLDFIACQPLILDDVSTTICPRVVSISLIITYKDIEKELDRFKYKRIQY
jgi:transposase